MLFNIAYVVDDINVFKYSLYNMLGLLCFESMSGTWYIRNFKFYFINVSMITRAFNAKYVNLHFTICCCFACCGYFKFNIFNFMCLRDALNANRGYSWYSCSQINFLSSLLNTIKSSIMVCSRYSLKGMLFIYNTHYIFLMM